MLRDKARWTEEVQSQKENTRDEEISLLERQVYNEPLRQTQSIDSTYLIFITQSGHLLCLLFAHPRLKCMSGPILRLLL